MLTIIRLPQVMTLTGLSRATIYARIAQGTFPSQVSLGERAVGWIEKEVLEWIGERVYQSRQQDHV